MTWSPVFPYKIYNVKDFCLVSDCYEVEKEKKKNDKSGEVSVGYQANFLDHLADDLYI